MQTYYWLGLGRPEVAAAIAERLVAAAPTPVHRTAAHDLLEAIETPGGRYAMRLALHATRLPDVHGEKLVSRKYRFFWVCVPKAASRSLIMALADADPGVELFREASIEDVLAVRPEAREYFGFAFVRNPYRRALSMYTDKFVVKLEERPGYLNSYHGLSADMEFVDICEWLDGPYGADAFANRHWLSQYRHLAASGWRPDFVGRVETIEEDLRTVTRRTGLPDLRLPSLNVTANQPLARENAEIAHRLARTCLTDRTRELLRRRYADDFRIYGYDQE